MRKRSLFWILGTLLITVVALNVRINLLANSAERSLVLANVEALADGESGGVKAPCYWAYSRDWWNDWYIIRCTDCTQIKVSFYINPSQCLYSPE